MLKFKLTSAVPEKETPLVLFAGSAGKQSVLPDGIPAALAATLKKLFKARPELLEKGKTAGFLSYESINTVNVFGLGELDKLTIDGIRHLGGDCVRALAAAKNFCPYAAFPKDFFKTEGRLAAFVEGAVLGGYVFDRFKSKKDAANDQIITLCLPGSKNIRALSVLAKNAVYVADNVNFARDLINLPGNIITPAAMAREAGDAARKNGLSFKVLDAGEMEKLGMGALLSVAKGSEQPPCLIVLEYEGAPGKQEKTAFVGKGITFDSGGISLKPSDGMGAMKDDMGGAAAVLASLISVACLKLPVNVLGILPCVENMPSGKAARPGDIVKAASGKTIEIISTDAEGRMLLADAVWYADKVAGASRIIDIATLTGAASVALGEIVSGVVSNDQALCRAVINAGKKSGEKCWQMPVFEEFKEYNKSDVADIKNSGGRYGGMITGGLFIGEFTDKPWAHIDIGNTVTSKETKGYNIKGPSGFGVRLLVEVAKSSEKY